MIFKKYKLIGIVLMIILMFFSIPALSLIEKVYAEEKLTIETLIKNYGNSTSNSQEITNSLTSFATDFGDSKGYATKEGWTTPSYTGATLADSNPGDFTSETIFNYDGNNVSLSSIGTDGTENNKFALLINLSDEGITGIESPDITIPAKSYYVLTFNVKIAELSGTKIGINAKIINKSTDEITSMTSITSETEDYKTYAFLIQGNENISTNIRLQILFGNAAENATGDATVSKQKGYGAIDTIRLFGVTRSQFEDLEEDKSAKTVILTSYNSSYENILNGFFNITDNNNWDINNITKLSDLKPLYWEKTGTSNTDFGIINTNETLFNEHLTKLGITAINPGNPDGRETSTNYNNILMLSNKEAGKQSIKSSTITLEKNSLYLLTFKFNTPANTEQTNKLSFYILNSANKEIYKQENIVSYDEYNGTNNEWKTYRVIIKTNSESEQKINFVISFGTDENNSTGYAYVDEIQLSKRTTNDYIFENTEENKYILKTEEGEETRYLAVGDVSLDDIKQLDTTKEINNEITYYEFVLNTTNEDNGTSNDETNTNNNNGSLAWYIIPSVLFGVALILGVILYYARKIKIKLPQKKEKNEYDRKQTLEKQIKEKEIIKKKEEKNKKIEKEIKEIEKTLENVEKEYENIKQNPTELKKYINKVEKLQNKKNKLQDILEKSNKE